MPDSDNIKRFISRYIGSVQQLNVLLALAADGSRIWTADEMAKKVGLDATAATNRLLNLCVKGLACAEGSNPRGFRYHPQDASIASTVNGLIVEYREQPGKILEQIYSKGEDRLRDFSDAFKLKQGEHNR